MSAPRDSSEAITGLLIKGRPDPAEGHLPAAFEIAQVVSHSKCVDSGGGGADLPAVDAGAAPDDGPGAPSLARACPNVHSRACAKSGTVSTAAPRRDG